MDNKNKPIAIVGIGCRFPGASSSPEKFWKMLVNQTDAIVDVPSDRWDMKRFYDDNDDRPGKMRAQQGGFLQEKIQEFDPLFFGISPREAESLDPQERLLLEVTYEAIEDAGVKMEEIKCSKTGVFVGGFTFDNYILQASIDNRKLINSHTSTGVTMTMLSNKISYAFDLKGPSVTMDTACSSSLVATHFACQSIWNNESKMALVGGVNIMIKPENSILMSKGKFLSKHSRCKAFDSDAGGYVRGEGAGMVLLKSIEDALKDGDRIYALIRGTGVNQDGQTNGISVPSESSQKELIRKIYAENNIDRKNIHYVEAHGTGTPVGDPIEFKVINDVLSDEGTLPEKCLIGSVKTNIGHLEAGAGVAGLIKVALCLHNNAVPPNLHFNNPNPKLNYENSILRVPNKVENLPERKESYASVNSFGYGGTNAHAVLQQFNSNEVKDEYTLTKSDQIIFPVCAKSPKALKELTKKYKDYIQQGDNSLVQILSNVIYRRSHHLERLTFVASSKEDLLKKMDAYEEEILLKGVSEGIESSKNPKIVFVYTGMGPQWWKMGRKLMETESVFYEAVKECDKEFVDITGWSILEELQKTEEESKVKETYIAQPTNFVIQVALTRLLEHYGITPSAIVGHSVGEVTSTYITGALTLRQALLVSYHRSRLQHLTSGKGTMLAVGLPESEMLEDIQSHDDISIAAINSSSSVTLSGDESSLEKLAKKYESSGVFNRMLDVTVPYHSPVMKEIEKELMEALVSIKGTATHIDLYSTVTADKIPGEEIDNYYWWRNVREPVYFAKTMEALKRDGYKIFIEVGPHPVLKNSMTECVQNNKNFHFLQTLNIKESEPLNFFTNLSSLFTLGCELKWERWVEKLPFLDLPSYAWQKERYWIESQKSIEDRLGREGSVFLNYLVNAPQLVYKVELNKYFFPFLNDHVVHGKVVFPGAGYIAAGIAFYQYEISQEVPFRLENIKFKQLLIIDNLKVEHLYTSFNPENNQFNISSKDEAENSSWFPRATGKFVVGKYTSVSNSIDIKGIRKRLHESLSGEEVYEKLSKSKLEYGLYFRTIKSVNIGKTELIAEIKGHENLNDLTNEYFIHPTLLDACFQSMIVFDDSEFVPVSIGKMHCNFAPGNEFFCYSRLTGSTGNSATADLIICDKEGNVAIEIEDFKCQELVSITSQSEDYLNDFFFEVEWKEEQNFPAISEFDAYPLTYIFVDKYEDCMPIIEQIKSRTIIVESGVDYKELDNDRYQANFQDWDSVNNIWKNDNQKEVMLISLLGLNSNQEASLMSKKCITHTNALSNIVRLFSDKTTKNVILNLITKGSQVVNSEDQILSPELSTIHGLGRLIGNELPEFQVGLIDFDGDIEPITFSSWTLALQKIYTSKSFAEVAIRNGRLYKKTMVASEENEGNKTVEEVLFKDQPLKLAVGQYTNLDELNFENTERIAPKEEEIEILIENTSINFKDYLKVSGKISSEALEDTYCEEKVGLDCCGIVTRIGQGVTKFKVGDKVVAFAAGTFQTYTTTSIYLVAKCPDQLKAGESNILTTYSTVIYGLEEKANLKKGQKVLIHNATGGVGLAAVNYAQMIGAEIFATAGTEEKRAFLTNMGIEHVYSSRNLDFSKKISEVTNKKGVDVVLSALPGEMLYQSLALIAPYGTYLEIGKKDIIDNAPLPMMFFNKNLAYISIDLDRMLLERKDKIEEILNKVCDYVRSEQLTSLPIKIFKPKNITEAFKLVDQSKHIGKVIIDFKDQYVEVEAQNDKVVKEDKTYLITGGTRGLGLEIAKWLVDKGAKHLALVSRSGLGNDQVKEDVNKMKLEGVNIQVYAVDISEKSQVGDLFTTIASSQQPIGGIFHCAMVLDDGFLMDMNEERFRKVLQPKVDGTMFIDEYSRSLSLDHFVLFSSISSLIGNMGQANYVAANAFLDTFAYVRKNQELPVTTINLGVLSESGVVARSENLEQILEGAGIRSFTNKQVLLGLEKILQKQQSQIGFFDLNWKTVATNFGGSGTILFQDLIQLNASSNERLSDQQIIHLETIKTLDSNAQHEYMVNFLTAELVKILKMTADQIRPDKGINFLGIDSILSVELIRRINEGLAIEIAPMEFLAGPSINQLSTIIVDKIVQSLEPELV